MPKKINIYVIILLDKLISFFFIIFFFPLLIIIFISLFFFNNREVFFISERVGFKNKQFKLIKFRTMKKNSNEEITKIGKILRRTSLDELPQFINVLKGDMSIVGPRPYPMNILKNNVDLMDLSLRHNVRPGITGYSQVYFSGKKRTLKEKINYDIYFVKNYSVILYFYIIIKTPITLIKRYFLNPTGKTL